MDLGGRWDFCWADSTTDRPAALTYEHPGDLPCSVYHLLHRAGILPDPYAADNSRLYHWTDAKVWYFRRRFSLRRPGFDGNAYLCFDGVSYYARVWVNGRLLGEHEGMFGGPCCDVCDCLNWDGDNELIVEVKACNFDQHDSFDNWNGKGQNTQIVPWNLCRCGLSGGGTLTTFGIWNEVRLELVPKTHISRPYLYTKSIDNNRAVLELELEIADGFQKELKPYYGVEEYADSYNRAYDTGLTGAVREEAVEVEVTLLDGDSCVCRHSDRVPLNDFDRLGMNPAFYELQFYRKELCLENPKLWYPNGVGEAFLYDAIITLSVDGRVLDTHTFRFGVRTFTADYTAGKQYRTRWEKFLFSVNGRQLFLKGMNWMPIDQLGDLSPQRYEWCLTMAKNAGIQLIRVWNGGGIQETDLFYDLCDRLGLLVWQDQYIANTFSTEKYPQQVLECQAAYNLYRLRNHPSLVILCGGNEFNPYKPGLAASMFVMQRTAETLAPDRVFHYTTADKGSAHIYRDMEPTWYRHWYKQLPFVGESGTHSFPTYRSLSRLISPQEAQGYLPSLSDPAFRENFPHLFHHFCEYYPDRITRMTARISQVVDMSHVTLRDLCEASQVQVYEFYQLLIQAMQENYPVCGGVMPWVFKRTWTTVGAQTVDGDDRPGYGYYAVQNTYRPINVCWCQMWSVLAPREELPLVVKVFNQNDEDISDTRIRLTVYAPDLTVYAEYEGAYAAARDFGKVKLDERFTNTCFLVCADLSREGRSVSRSVYFNKCTDQLADEERYRQHRSAPAENLYFEDGPWLKPTIQRASAATLEARVVERGTDGVYPYADICLKNGSPVPAYPVTVDLEDEDGRCFLDENFFLLKPGEEKIVRLTRDRGEIKTIRVDFWNGAPIVIS